MTSRRSPDFHKAVIGEVFLVRNYPIADHGDEPEQEQATDEVRADILLTPAAVGGRADTGHVPVPNPNHLPDRRPETKALEPQNSHSDRRQTRSEPSNESLV